MSAVAATIILEHAVPDFRETLHFADQSRIRDVAWHHYGIDAACVEIPEDRLEILRDARPSLDMDVTDDTKPQQLFRFRPKRRDWENRTAQRGYRPRQELSTIYKTPIHDTVSAFIGLKRGIPSDPTARAC